MQTLLKALIVGSDAQVRKTIRAHLQALAPTQSEEADNLTAALAAIGEQRFDLALCDHQPPLLDGIAFTRALRLIDESPNPYLPLVLVLGSTDRQTVEAARDAGVTEILVKPLGLPALASRIDEIVERPRAFVRCQNYFGPDRRRRRNGVYAGPLRRTEDLCMEQSAAR